MPSLLERFSKFRHERPGIMVLLCLAFMPVAAFVGVISEEAPLDEQRSRYELLQLEAVESSNLIWQEGLAWLKGEGEPFNGWEKQVVTIEDYAEEVQVSLSFPTGMVNEKAMEKATIQIRSTFRIRFMGAWGTLRRPFINRGDFGPGPVIIG